LLMNLARPSPTIRELDETRHQFDRPFVLDSSAAQRTFGLAPTDWSAVLAETVGGQQDAARSTTPRTTRS
jgi:hypothetical protein